VKAYLIITGVLFGLLALAHLLRTIAEWSRLATDSWFVVQGPGIGIVAAALCFWAGRLLRRSLTEALPQLVWSATPDGACDYFSTQWTQHTGVPESDLLGWRWLATLHPDDRKGV
jgi:PAS domain-containing protein